MTDITLLHPSMVPLQGGINFRDQGGYRVQDGRRIKYGVLFRSGALNELTEKDCQYLTSRSISHILDYRDQDEVESKPNKIWQNADYKNISANPVMTSINASFAKPSLELLTKIDPAEFMAELYSRLPFNNPAYRQLVALLQQPDCKGLVQHCAVGKDRTGIGSALVLFILGADLETVMEDYLITETTLAPHRERILQHMTPALNNHAIANLQYALSTREEFLNHAYQAILQRYKSVDRWLETEFNLTPSQREQMRNRYLEG